jgi:hypothetical protein
MLSIHPGQINIYHRAERVDFNSNKEDNQVCIEQKGVIQHIQLGLFEPEQNIALTVPGVPLNQKPAETEKKFQHLLDSARSAKGKVSIIARRKMNKALNYMLFLANEKTYENRFSGRLLKFRIAFVTLTLPSSQVHTDNEIKNICLNQFLIEIKKAYHVQNYIWRAEKQSNGNIHFHIIVDKFIPWQEMRDRWNRIINKLGYVDRYREEQTRWHKNGFRVRKNLLPTWPLRKQKQAYERGAKLHWHSPNSTDIHGVHKIRDVRAYISKYLTKPDLKEKLKKLRETQEKLKKLQPGAHINSCADRARLLANRRRREKNIRIQCQSGRIWGCSQNLSNIRGAQAVIDSEIEEELRELLENPKTRTLRDNYFSVVFFPVELILKKPSGRLFRIFSKYMFDVFQHTFQVEFAMN